MNGFSLTEGKGSSFYFGSREDPLGPQVRRPPVHKPTRARSEGRSLQLRRILPSFSGPSALNITDLLRFLQQETRNLHGFRVRMSAALWFSCPLPIPPRSLLCRLSVSAGLPISFQRLQGLTTD